MDGNDVHANAFNIARAYVNVTGNISHIVAFRVTPDITREIGTGSSLNGSLHLPPEIRVRAVQPGRLDERGSFARFGMQQTPWIDFIDSVYRYRFQGPTMEDREGILSSADVGATFRYVFAGNYGDVHGGIYNGDNYNRPKPNDQKALMVRATVSPVPAHPTLRGLRVTGFYDHDAYVKDAERPPGDHRRHLRASLLQCRHQRLLDGRSDPARHPKLDGHGLSVWVTPKTLERIRMGRAPAIRPSGAGTGTSTLEGNRNRTIAGIAYWFPRQGNVSSAAVAGLRGSEQSRLCALPAARAALDGAHAVNF